MSPRTPMSCMVSPPFPHTEHRATVGTLKNHTNELPIDHACQLTWRGVLISCVSAAHKPTRCSSCHASIQKLRERMRLLCRRLALSFCVVTDCSSCEAHRRLHHGFRGTTHLSDSRPVSRVSKNG